MSGAARRVERLQAEVDRRARGRVRRAGRVTVRLTLLGALPAGAILNATTAPGAGAVRAHSLSAALAVIAASSEITGVFVRRFLTTHWDDKRVVPWCLAEIGSVGWLTCVASANFFHSLNIYLTVAGYAIAWMSYLVVQIWITKLVWPRTRTYFVRRRKIGGMTIEEVVKRFAARSKFFRPPLALFRSGKTWSAYAALVNLVFTGILVSNGTAAVRHFHATHPTLPVLALVEDARAEGQVRWRLGRLRALDQAQEAAARTVNVAAPVVSTPASPTWDALCGGGQPGRGAAAWVMSATTRLYLGDGGPGAVSAGCAGPAKTLEGVNDFAYTVGYGGSGEIRSVAVVTRAHKDQDGIFLGDAAVLALKLIAVEGRVGASPRIDVGAGDFYVASTGTGSWVFARSTKNAPYVVVPPRVARKLIATMTRRGSWLWPALVRGNGLTMTSLYRFETVSGEVVDSARYGSASGLTSTPTEKASASLSVVVGELEKLASGNNG
jgi:hypothetical protein